MISLRYQEVSWRHCFDLLLDLLVQLIVEVALDPRGLKVHFPISKFMVSVWI